MYLRTRSPVGGARRIAFPRRSLTIAIPRSRVGTLRIAYSAVVPALDLTTKLTTKLHVPGQLRVDVSGLIPLIDEHVGTSADLHGRAKGVS